MEEGLDFANSLSKPTPKKSSNKSETNFKNSITFEISSRLISFNGKASKLIMVRNMQNEVKLY